MLALLLAAGLGSAQLHASCAPAAQKPFARGVLQLHSFMYEDARESFEAALKADPKCAIARWGMASTWDHPLWSDEDVEKSRKALEGISNAGVTPLEMGLIEAAQALNGDGDTRARHEAWRERLARLHAQLPHDDEAQLFYALSLFATSSGGRNVKRAMEAGALALEVYARKPDHPGAAHYVIHSFDSPEHAILALPAAQRYAQIAPEAGHALHMPSHIFLQLGMWREAEASNVASFAASQKEWARRGKREHWRDWHSYLWLMNARVELGKIAEAEPLLTTVRESLKLDNHPGSRWSYAFLVGIFLGGTEQWSRAEELLAPLDKLSAAEDEPADEAVHCPTDLPSKVPTELLARLFAARLRLHAAANAGDEARAREVSGQLDGLVARILKAQPGALPADVQERLKLLAAARLAQARARHDGALLPHAIEATRALAEAEEKVPLIGPLVEPLARIDQGALLMLAGKPAEAMGAYRAALDRRAHQSAALLGLAQAAHAAGNAAVEAEARAELAVQWKNADAEIARRVQTASAP